MAFTLFPTDSIPQAHEDPHHELVAACSADKDVRKIDLGIGAYRDEHGQPWVLPVVKKADEILRSNTRLNHEYLPITGLPEFTSAAARLIFGEDCPAMRENRVTSVQTISGTGAIHLGALFLAKFYRPQQQPHVYLSDPTWPNHAQIFSNVGLPIQTYPYFNPQTKTLDFDGMLAQISSAPENSIILLHSSAHNPTGVDPTQAQWSHLAAAIRTRRHFPFFDSAYQGFASGNLAHDAWTIRHFVSQGLEVCISQSFAKNLGLYGQRVGCLHWVTAGAEAPQSIQRIAAQLAMMQRAEISTPPAYGARIAALVMNDEKLFAEWEADLRTMSGRIREMREALRAKLELLGTPGCWRHITDQIGMFSFTGLSEAQVQKLRANAHVYMAKTGRISLAGLNTANVEDFARAVNLVVRYCE